MISGAMRIISRRPLKLFSEVHPRAEGPLRAWHAFVTAARWRDPEDVKRMFGNRVDFVRDNRAIFDLGGNKYRLIVHISYELGRVLVKFVGTHAEYDRIDPEKVQWRRRS
jgi:mRNA interferase HigB